MKKDSYTIGVALVFISFVLMVGFFIYENWKLNKTRKLVDNLKATKPTVEAEKRDYSQFKLVDTDDGGKMVFIPGGHFSMGSPPAEGDSDEIPQRVVYISPFYIDLYEITHDQFSRFVKGTKFPKPVIPYFEDDLSLINRPELPVVGVSWEHANEYCKWIGKRLPTEAEWEKAARGDRALKWPWGNHFSEDFVNSESEVDGYRYSAPPGKFEKGRSPFGVYDMAGNVAEWVADWYDPDYYQEGIFRHPKGPDQGKHRGYRGGSWNDSSANLRTPKRFAAAPHQSGVTIGFRCVMDPLEKEG
jgi:formylglycine-generating enzyme required for sulfatase activity